MSPSTRSSIRLSAVNCSSATSLPEMTNSPMSVAWPPTAGGRTPWWVPGCGTCANNPPSPPPGLARAALAAAAATATAAAGAGAGLSLPSAAPSHPPAPSAVPDAPPPDAAGTAASSGPPTDSRARALGGGEASGRSVGAAATAQSPGPPSRVSVVAACKGGASGVPGQAAAAGAGALSCSPCPSRPCPCPGPCSCPSVCPSTPAAPGAATASPLAAAAATASAASAATALAAAFAAAFSSLRFCFNLDGSEYTCRVEGGLACLDVRDRHSERGLPGGPTRALMVRSSSASSGSRGHADTYGSPHTAPEPSLSTSVVTLQRSPNSITTMGTLASNTCAGGRPVTDSDTTRSAARRSRRSCVPRMLRWATLRLPKEMGSRTWGTSAAAIGRGRKGFEEGSTRGQ